MSVQGRPDVVAQLLAAHASLRLLPDAREVGEHATRALRILPGARAAAARLNGVEVRDGGWACARSDVLVDEPDATEATWRDCGSAGSVLVLPARTTHESYGSLFLLHGSPKAVQPYVPLLANLAAAIAVELENRSQRLQLEAANATLEQRVEERAGELARTAARAAALAHAAARLSAQGLNFEAVLAAVCSETRSALSAPAATVWLFDEARGALVPAARLGLPGTLDDLEVIPRALYDELVRRHGGAAAFPDLGALAEEPGGQAFAAAAHLAAATASMFRDHELVGVLSVLAPGQARVFTEDDVTLLQGLADHAAQAIANARLFDEGQRRVRLLAALTRVDVAIASSLDLEVILDLVLDQATTELEADAADILLLDTGTQTLNYAAGRGFRPEDIAHTRLRFDGDEEYARAITEGRLLHLHDLPAADNHPRSVLAEREGLRTYHAAPLTAKGEIKGLLEVYQRTCSPCTVEWARFLETLAGKVAIGIDSVSLFLDVQRTNRELVTAYDVTLDGWSRALDLRDKETEGHTLRVADATLGLARAMKMPPADLVHLRRGALLHDIGKMGIPDAILRKPGRLDEGEWDVMRKHPVYAYELLSPISYLRRALEIPYCHHERWDGSGYPRGLKGVQIPLAARVFAVIDVWDALTSDRPYRKAWPAERALDHIRDGAGAHFDPEVAEAFLRSERER